MLKKDGFEEIATIEEIKIETIKNINWSNTPVDLKILENYIKNMPPELKGCVKKITIYDIYNPYDPYWTVEYKNGNDFYSGCTGGGEKINIYATLNGYPNAEFGEILHEAGHNYDYAKAPEGYGALSGTPEWENAMINDSQINNNVIGVTPYATQAKNASNTNIEDFADSVRLYYIDPEAFAKKYPNRYAILSSI